MKERELKLASEYVKYLHNMILYYIAVGILSMMILHI